MFQQWLVALLSVGGVLGNLLPGDLGRGTHHQLPHPHHQDHHHPGHHADHHHTDHTHGKELGHHSTDHNHGGHTNLGKHVEEAKRRGRQEDDEGFVGQLIDFSSAVEDPSTGLKCVLEEATVDTFEKERLLTCTHSMIQVLHCWSLSVPCFKPYISPGLPLHLCDPVPSSPCGGVQ